MEIKGIRALVVGGASGMARATAERIAAGGGQVAIVDRPGTAGPEVAQAIGGVFVEGDILDYAGIGAVIDGIVEAFGGLDVGVNVAGGGIAARTLDKTGAPHDLDAFRQVVEVNLVATFNLNRLEAAAMARNEPNADGERGVIINTSSLAAFEGQIGQVAYGSAKAGVSGLSLPMARDLGALGIRVNAIAPSLFDTGIVAGIPDDMKSNLTKDAPFPSRMGKPDEYARLAVAIIENPMLNGGTIRIDGAHRFTPR